MIKNYLCLEKAVRVVNAFATLVIAACVAFLTYQQYLVQKSLSEPFFNLKIEGRYDDGLKKFVDDFLVVRNDGAHARNIIVDSETFFLINDLDQKFKYKKFYIPASYYTASFHTGNSQGIIVKSFTFQNRLTLMNAINKIIESRIIMDISVVSFTTISYRTITGEKRKIFFRNEIEIDEMPDFIYSMRHMRKLDIENLSYSSICEHVAEGSIIPISQSQ
ncbi:hypothetical protein [Desulfovibrio sp. 86]|uniref:Uncharacterized protein n=1 Tax=uncultured Desulfovibrio sp. TaxID=167968 RepID=A0A212L7U7_9BACT|nr:hypothetical protein [Desulfovibrio sp. 86]SCM73598.1 hypothetical protein KL86DES1_21405 [uncultured Desulfovibrio sp.]VZH34302.1 conserved protein of unknown function [Desulfovibrio sp. 86]